MENAHITPHVGGMMTWEDYDRLSTGVFLDNLDRFARGEPLRNVTDPQRGLLTWRWPISPGSSMPIARRGGASD